MGPAGGRGAVSSLGRSVELDCARWFDGEAPSHRRGVHSHPGQTVLGLVSHVWGDTRMGGSRLNADVPLLAKPYDAVLG